MLSSVIKQVSNKQGLQTIQRYKETTNLLKLKELSKYEYKGTSKTPSILIRNNHIDSSIWDEFQVQDTDIYVNTPAKSGTTWMQEICAQLLYNGDLRGHIGTDNIHDISPWLAMAIQPREHILALLNEQSENENIKRRVIKTHEPVESMPFNPNCKYIVVGRDFRDVVWSLYNHYSLFSDQAFETFNAPRPYKFQQLPPWLITDATAFKEYDMFNMQLDGATPDDGNPDGAPWWSQFWVIGSWWQIRKLSNVKMIHFQNMKDDLEGTMRSVAEFCEIDIDENNFANVVHLCSFESMKQRKIAPVHEKLAFLFNDFSKFLNKGQAGRWETVLTEEDNERYRYVARRYLDDDGIKWLETGKLD